MSCFVGVFVCCCFRVFDCTDRYWNCVRVPLLSMRRLSMFSQFNDGKDKPVLRPGESRESGCAYLAVWVGGLEVWEFMIL